MLQTEYNEEEVKIMGGKVLVLESERLLNRGIKEGKTLGREEGGNLKIYELVADGTISPQQGAKNLGITIAELKRKMEITGYRYPT